MRLNHLWRVTLWRIVFKTFNLRLDRFFSPRRLPQLPACIQLSLNMNQAGCVSARQTDNIPRTFFLSRPHNHFCGRLWFTRYAGKLETRARAREFAVSANGSRPHGCSEQISGPRADLHFVWPDYHAQGGGGDSRRRATPSIKCRSEGF